MSCNKQNPQRPVVHYHGGKWRIAKWVISHFPKHNIYVEPFGGGASVLLRKPRSRMEVYNDLDDEIVNVFRTLRRNGEKLIEQLKLTPYSRSEFHSCYKPGTSNLERARQTIVKSFLGFGGNGIYRRTGFRTSIRKASGPEKSWLTYPDNLRTSIERLKGVVIEKGPAIEVMKRNDSRETLHYVDPPYLMSTRDAGSDYRCELTEDDHHELAEVLHSLKGAIVLSGYPDPLYDRLFKRWKTAQRNTRAASHALRTEKLWIRNARRPSSQPGLCRSIPSRCTVISSRN